MKKLYVFGDSYVAADRNSIEWTRLLANKLDAEYENFGVNGSSSEHAMRQFQQTISNNNISNGIIIMLLSTIGRLDLEFQIERPETASIYISTNLDQTDPKHEWYRENRKHIEWLTVNHNYKSSELNRECYIHAMKNYAESEPSNMVIVLQNTLKYSDLNSLIPIGNLPVNFIVPEIDVNQISRDEMIDRPTYNEFVKHTSYDPRINHLTNPNLEIMAESIHQMIVTRDVSKLSYDNFQKNVIKKIRTQQQLDEYIQAGILHPNVIREVK